MNFTHRTYLKLLHYIVKLETPKGFSCRWRIRATRCITTNLLQTKVDAQCDKRATELSSQLLQRSTFSSYKPSRFARLWFVASV